MATIDNNLSKLTPEEFAEFYMAGLKKELGMYSLQANKVGFLGFLVNILGNITYDAKIYRDFLFKEAFPATAQQDENVFLHGAIYGFKTNLATPANAVGTLTFDFSYLPSVSNDVIRREVVFGNKLPLTEIKVGDVIFSTTSQYTFVKEGDAYKTVVSRLDGSKTILPSNTAQITVPFDNFKQEKSELISFELPSYAHNSYYIYDFSLSPGEYLSEVTVNIKLPTEGSYSNYEVVRSKYLVGGLEKKVFLTQKSDTSYSLEFGSGVHGVWVPNGSVNLYIFKTLGTAANFSQNIKSDIVAPTSLVVYNVYNDGHIDSTTVDPDYVGVNFKYSEGAIDPLSGEYLRKALVNFIETRDNFISENDHYNIIEKYTTDFRLLFKKMLIQENVFYLQRVLRDDYQNPIRSLNIMPEIFSSTQKLDGAHFTVREEGSLGVGLYYYVIRAEDLFKNIVSTGEIIVPVTATTGSTITLEWNSIPGAVKYTVYGRSPVYDRLWETRELRIEDDGSDNGARISLKGLPKIEKEPYALYPKLEYAGTEFTSPFAFKFNSIYNFYEGWLFYDSLLINFKTVDIENILSDPNNKITNSTIPAIYLTVEYDHINEKSLISIKSYQQIDEVVVGKDQNGNDIKMPWNFYISIPEYSIKDIPMICADDSTFTYEYVANHGLITTPIETITIDGIVGGTKIFTAKSPKVTQLFDITDHMQIPKYKYDGVNYLVDVPIIESSTFEANKNYFLDKMMEFLYGFNFEENRMVSDNLEFRFLNTDSIRSFLLINSLVQGKSLYKDLQYLDKVNPISIATCPDTILYGGETWIIGSTKIPIVSTNIDGYALDIYQERGFSGLFDSAATGTTSPYSIIVRGDYSGVIKSPETIVVKGARSMNVNGRYHVLNAFYNAPSDMTTIYVIEKINISAGEGELHYATYPQWRQAGPDNIVRWNALNDAWEYTDINVGDIVTVSQPLMTTYVYAADHNYVEYTLKLPLKLRLTIFVDKNAVSKYNIDLEDERNKIALEIAKFLQLYVTGTDICYYPSVIIDYVSEARRLWIKGVVITTTDSTEPIPFEFKNGIETYPEDEIRKNIGRSKFEMLKYTSAFYWWDVDNIKIDYEFNG